MAEQNPYKLLNIPQDASIEQVEDAYDTLFDLHEPKARRGDESEVAFLYSLNAARDTLVDPQKRAAYDAALPAPTVVRPAPKAAPRLASSPAPKLSTTQKAQAATPRRGAAPTSGQAPTVLTLSTMTVRKRSANRSTLIQEERNTRHVPLMLAGVLLLVFLASVAIFLLVRPKDAPLATPIAVNGTPGADTTLGGSTLPGSGPTPTPAEQGRGQVLATVNGVPIYSDDWQARLERDKNTALSDPLYTSFFNNFQGITGTRALDIVSYDSLDKLINMEMIQQQATKEGLYPTEAQKPGLIDQAKQDDLKNGKTFEQFLKDKNITAEKYNRNVIQNVVYLVVADRHIPKTGTPDERTNAFLKWICDTRRAYQVRLYKQFIVKENQPCTSGLPTDLPLPGIDQGTTVPDEIATALPQANPQPTPGTPATPANPGTPNK